MEQTGIDMTRYKIERAVDGLRYISFIAVSASGLGSIIMFVMGAIKTARAYMAYFGGMGYEQPDSSSSNKIVREFGSGSFLYPESPCMACA